MATKTSRAGGKYTGNHTTLIPAAVRLCTYAEKCDAIIRITPGFIKAGLPSVSGNRRVKIEQAGPTAVKLSVRDNTSHQEVYCYTRSSEDTLLAIAALAAGARKEHLTPRVMKG